MRIRLAALLWLAASIVPAAADSRDLVMDRLARCYSITETRQYLDCFYAAAQPMRSELGLPAAPQAQNFAPLFMRPAQQGAYVPMSSQGGAQASAPRQEESGWGVDILSSVMGMKTVKVPPEQFGLKNAKPGPGLNVDQITARMASYSFNKQTGFFTVTLDNGQVWEQLPGDEHSPVWNHQAQTYQVTVKYGAMGSYNLATTDDRLAYKVRRVR